MKYYWSCPFCYIVVPLFRKSNLSYDALERRITNHLRKRHAALFTPNELPSLIKKGIRQLDEDAVKRGGEKT